MNFLRRLFSRKPLTASEIVFRSLTRRDGAECPDCHGDMFLMGPQGGCAQNIKCANKECGSEFNVAPFDGGWCGAPMIAARI